MLFSFVDEVDKSGTAVPSSSAPAGEKERPVATSLLINVSALTASAAHGVALNSAFSCCS
jgi:hypothetical protein